jgi:MSHA type pilus biogenesis protein MshL
LKLKKGKGNMDFKKIAIGMIVLSFLWGCSSVPKKPTDKGDAALKEAGNNADDMKKKSQPLELGINRRMFTIPLEQEGEKDNALYKFRAKDMPLTTALDLFARTYGLNIISSPDVAGNVTVDFNGLPFEKAMEAILDAYGYYWVKEEDLIRVYKYETRIFSLDYIRLVREGSGASQASVASSGVGSGGQSGEVTIKQSDTVKFWEDLETQLKAMVSAEGKISINRMSGTIQVTDYHKDVAQVERYLNNIRNSVSRQVEIEARIMEVSLNDEFSLGIDWSVLINKMANGAINSSNIVAAKTASTIGISFGILDQNDFKVVLDALKQQGEVKVVSNPRIRVMNNQPALIKVGTDRPFFESTTTIGQGQTDNTVTEQIRYITEGLVLSITPQVSGNGWIMLDVTPIITRLAGTETSKNGSTAPTMEVKQSSTVIRMKDGEMVTVGGLIQDEGSATERAVPVFGEIPIFGNLFKGKHTANKKTELVIFMTPRIIKDL